MPVGVHCRKKKTKPGYIMLNWRIGRAEWVRAFEHRIVDGKVTTAEHVHHINGIKDDNRPANLAFITKSEHSSLHNRVEYDETAACEMYLSGASSIATGKAFGVSSASILRMLDRRGIGRRRTCEPVAIDYAAVEDMYQRGVRGMAMMRQLKVGRKTLARAFRELGLQPFPSGMPVHWSRYEERARI